MERKEKREGTVKVYEEHSSRSKTVFGFPDKK
jgi:hypothetical protein